MPILQNKLVIKSIEALHDEALALLPNTDHNLDVNAQTRILQINTPAQDSAISELRDTSTNASPETVAGHNIMARIDHLLRKLDKDEDAATAPPSEKEPETNSEDWTSDAVYSTANGNSDDTFDDVQEGKKPRPDQTQALADIAEAIYQAQHQAVETVAADANHNSPTPFDMDVFSAKVADEIRRTVSAVMVAELPHLVREAIGEEIRAFTANALGQSKPVIGNPSAIKPVAERKTAAARKSGGKKAGTKKTVAKKASSKSGPKKLKPKKVGKKTTAKTIPST